jgi:hypothetical protein
MFQYNEQEMKEYKLEHTTPLEGVQILYDTLGAVATDDEHPF